MEIINTPAALDILQGGAISVPGQQVIIAPLAGQSNANGRNAVDGVDVDVTDVFQFGGDSAQGDYQTLASDITPMDHPEQLERAGPDIAFLAQLKSNNPDAIIVGVPLAEGSSLLFGGPWAVGGAHFNFMKSQTEAARTAVLTAYPGASISYVVYWAQGEQDAATSVTKANHYTGLSAIIADFRANVTGATNAKWIIASMVPDTWEIGHVNYNAAYALINEAHVQASTDLTNVIYHRGEDDPGAVNDNLHYQPASVARTVGTNAANKLTDSTGPTMTSPTTADVGSGGSLALVLTGSEDHQTFELDGGADVASFSISDPYLSATLEWSGATPAVGSYVVGVRARDGAGNYGATQTVTVSVVAEVSPASFFTASEEGNGWDLTDLASLFQNNDETTAATDTDPVGWVGDISPNGNPWEAISNNTTRPVLGVDSDGDEYLLFDGSNDVLRSLEPFVVDGTAQVFTAIVGIYAAAQSAEKRILSATSDTGGVWTIPMASDGSTTSIKQSTRNNGGSGGSTATLTGVLDSSKRIITSIGGGTGATWKMRNAASRPSGGGDGAYTSVSQGTTGTAFTTTRMGLGATATTTPGNFFSGRIYSGFVIGRVLTDAEIKDGEDWVANRMSLVLP